MGFRPTQADEEWLRSAINSPWKRSPPPFPPDRRKSWAFGPPKLMKSDSCSAATVPGGTTLPFVISTEA
jgi:hypothetical protein